MELHRTTGKPDWAAIAAKDQNVWQRWAAATNGIISPANIVTTLGFILVVIGLIALVDRNYWLGGISLLVGRLCDIADGWVAEHTGTKSPFGELYDATIDKIGVFLSAIVFYTTSVAPRAILLLLILPQVIVTILSVTAWMRDDRFHPSRLGKVSFAVAWASLLGYVFRDALQASPTSAVGYLVSAITGVAIVMCYAALLGYVRRPQH